MDGFGWFGLFLGLLGIVTIFSSTYEWPWWGLRWNNVDIRELVGSEKARLINLAGGFFFLGVGTSLVIRSVLAIQSLNAFLIGFAFSAVITKIIYESREGQSIGELIQFKAERKPKSKHGEEE